MKMQRTPMRDWPAAGVFAGAGAWAVSMQANYALAQWSCAHQMRVVPFVALLLAAISMTGGFVSWRSLKMRSARGAFSHDGGRPRSFLAVIGIGAAMLFTIVIILHGLAGLMMSGCER